MARYIVEVRLGVIFDQDEASRRSYHVGCAPKDGVIGLRLVDS